MPF
ncbi:hypothetical protein CPC197_0129A, partial [Chlamydia psittaci C1/97]|jgi:hypothetical protein